VIGLASLKLPRRRAGQITEGRSAKNDRPRRRNELACSPAQVNLVAAALDKRRRLMAGLRRFRISSRIGPTFVTPGVAFLRIADYSAGARVISRWAKKEYCCGCETTQ
jgi:hypothetical protein